MATFHSNAQIISRSSGRSSVAAAAYRAGERLGDHRTGLTHDFSNKPHIIHSEIVLPTGAPEAFRDRETLWNAVETAETRKNSQVGPEGPSLRKRTVRNENTGEILPISGETA